MGKFIFMFMIQRLKQPAETKIQLEQIPGFMLWEHLTEQPLKVYVNGQQVGSVPAGDTFTQYTLPDFLIQGSTGNIALGGGLMAAQIDDVMLFNRALTDDEVLALYNATAVNHTSNLDEGNYTYKVYAEDLAGNVGSAESDFTVDTTPPVATMTATAGGDSYTGGWTDQNIDLSISCSDEGGNFNSGCQGIYLCTDYNGTACDPSATDYNRGLSYNMLISTNQDTTWRWQAEDNAGNWSDVGSLHIQKNDVQPFVGVVGAPTFCNNNGICEPSLNENAQDCPGDCNPCNRDNICERDAGENSQNCPCDCGGLCTVWTSCNHNGICEPNQHENSQDCPDDCPPPIGNIGPSGGGVNWTNGITIPLSCSDPSGLGGCSIYTCYDTSGSSQCDPKTDSNPGTGSKTLLFNSTTLSKDINTTARWIAKDDAGNWSSQGNESVAVDITPPTRAIASVNAVSNSEIDATAAVSTDASSGLPANPYQFKVNSTELGWQSGTSVQKTGLSPNTQYSFSVETRDAVGNTSGYSTPIQKYTLANVPANLTLSSTQTQISASWSANSNPDGTQYYIEDAANPANNSGWTTSNSWAFLGLSCGTSYSFHIKAENGDSVATNYTDSVSVQTNPCAVANSGGGSGGANYLNTSEELVLLINGGETTTDSTDVILTLRGPSDASKMIISENPDFAEALQQPYATSKYFTLSDGNVQKTIYVKFFNAAGQASQVISQNINLKQSVPIPEKLGTLAQGVQQGYQSTLNAIKNQVQNIQNSLNLIPQQAQQIKYPPIGDVVKENPPPAFQSPWAQILAEPVSNFANNPLPREFSDIVVKFPQLEQTLKSLA